MPEETQEDYGRDAPAFDFYCERWTHGTRHMTKVERCDYLDLLLHQWTSDGLPADLDMLARLVGYRKGSQISPLVVEKFPIAEDGKRRNARLEEERMKQRDRIRRKRQGADLTNAKKRARKSATVDGASKLPQRGTGPGAADGATPGERLAYAERDDSVAQDERLACAERNDSVAQDERLACAERNDIVTPPPTTHHPPQNPIFSLSHPPEGSGWPATEEQCRGVAVCNGVDPEYAVTIWNLHESSGDYTQKDMHGNSKPILKFANYLKFRWNCRTRRIDDVKALEKTKMELRRQSPQQATHGPGVASSKANGGGSRPGLSARAEQRGEIPTDVSMDKVKVYRLENCEHE